MRRVGMGIGLSKAKMASAMLDILSQLPIGTTNLKDTVVYNMGIMGQMAATRDINEAWNITKKKAAKEYQDRFILDERGIIHWNDGKIKLLDKKISKTNFEKLNKLAATEGCDVNKIVTKLISAYRKQKA